jgi:hypothetical protein
MHTTGTPVPFAHRVSFFSLALILLLPGLLAPAFAQGSPTDDDVTCDGPDCGPIDTGDGNDTVTVADGGVVQAPTGLEEPTSIRTGDGIDSVHVEQGGTVLSGAASYSFGAENVQTAPARACGVGGLGSTSVDNHGLISSHSDSVAWAHNVTGDPDTRASATSWNAAAFGVETSDHDDSVRNWGTIDVSVNSGNDLSGAPDTLAYAETYNWSADATVHTLAHTDVSATGVCTRGGDDRIENHGLLTVQVHGDRDAGDVNDAIAGGWAGASDADAAVRSDADAIAGGIGIDAGGGEDDILNRGEIVVAVETDAEACTWADARSPVNEVEAVTARGEAFATTVADAVGIYAVRAEGDDESYRDRVVNDGTLTVTAESSALTLSSVSAENFWWDANACVPEDAATDAGAFSLATADAAGVLVDGDADIVTTPGSTIDVRAVTDASARALAQQPQGLPAEWTAVAGAYGYSTATAIELNGNEHAVLNEGLLSAVSEGLAEAESPDSIVCASDGTIEARAFGIRASGGSAVVANTGEIVVDASATADRGAMALARGIDVEGALDSGGESAPGDDVVRNLGRISVTAAFDGDCVDGTALAHGIVTGAGDDLVVNEGSIEAVVRERDAASLGISIRTGDGNDAVVLGHGSSTIGHVELGDGDDVLGLFGGALLDGQVRGGPGWDTLTLDEVGTCTLVQAPVGMEEFALGQATLQVLDDFVLAPDARVSTTISGDGRSGRLVVGGALDLTTTSSLGVPGLGPGLEVTAADRVAYRDGQSYDVVLVDSLVGRFSEVTLPEATMFLDFRLAYVDTADDPGVDCAQVRVDVRPFGFHAGDDVKRGVALALDRLLPQATGDLSAVMAAFQFADSPAAVERGFASLSPDIYDGYSRTTFDVVQGYHGVISHRIDTARTRLRPFEDPAMTYTRTPGGAIRAAPSPARRGFWASALGEWGDHDADAGFQGFDYTVAGATVGYDRLMGKSIIGGNLGATATSVDVDDDFGDGDIDSTFASFYWSWFVDRGFVQSSAAYAEHDYENDRDVPIGGLARRAEADHDGDSASLRVKGGLDFPVRSWVLEPFSALWYSSLDEDGFQETGAGAANLVVDSRSTEALISDLGLRVSGDLERRRGRLVPELVVAWIHDFEIDDRTLVSWFEGSPGAPIVFDGRSVGTDGASLGLGLSYLSDKGWTASFRYDGRTRDTYLAHALVGDFRLVF